MSALIAENAWADVLARDNARNDKYEQHRSQIDGLVADYNNKLAEAPFVNILQHARATQTDENGDYIHPLGFYTTRDDAGKAGAILTSTRVLSHDDAGFPAALIPFSHNGGSTGEGTKFNAIEYTVDLNPDANLADLNSGKAVVALMPGTVSKVRGRYSSGCIAMMAAQAGLEYSNGDLVMEPGTVYNTPKRGQANKWGHNDRFGFLIDPATAAGPISFYIIGPWISPGKVPEGTLPFFAVSGFTHLNAF